MDADDRAQEAEDRGDLVSALELWKELTRRDRAPVFFTRLGLVAQKLERWGEAEHAFAEAIRLDPSLALAMVCMGDLWAARTDKTDDESFPIAKAWFLKALEHERSAPTLILLGAMYRAWRDNRSAQDVLTEALNLDPDNPEGLYNLALALPPSHLPKSIELMQRAIEIEPRYFAAHQELGKLYHRAGDLVAAEYHFRRSLDVEPKSFGLCCTWRTYSQSKAKPSKPRKLTAWSETITRKTEMQPNFSLATWNRSARTRNRAKSSPRSGANASLVSSSKLPDRRRK
jgi:tetratricopeptide (TPR) repeat protein